MFKVKISVWKLMEVNNVFDGTMVRRCYNQLGTDQMK